LTEILVTVSATADRFKIIQMLYGLMGLQFSDEATYISTTKLRLNTCKIIKEYIEDKKGVSIKTQLRGV